MAERRVRALAAQNMAVSLFVANGSSGESAEIALPTTWGTPNAWAPAGSSGIGSSTGPSCWKAHLGGLPVLSNEAGNCPALTRPREGRG